MKIKLNGKDVEIEHKMTILTLLVWKEIIPAHVIVEHNFNIPERGKWKDIELNDGDSVEIIKFMGGG